MRSGIELSDQAALKRVRVGRLARRLPAVFDAIADGRLHVSGALLLKPHLTSDNAVELIGAASNRTTLEIELMLATRYPKPDVPPSITPVGPVGAVAPVEPVAEDVLRASKIVAGDIQLSSRTVVGNTEGDLAGPNEGAVAARPTPPASPGVTRAPCPRVKPLAPERFALQVTISGTTREKLTRARELLSHRIPSGDLAEVLDLALDALVDRLEKRKLAVTKKPRAQRSGSTAKNPRTIPARVKREVVARDGGRCTFVGTDGHRCGSRCLLEFDHIEPLARGGTSSASNLRLRCRTHLQHAADQVFGAGFMHRKRQRTRGGVLGSADEAPLRPPHGRWR